MLSRRFRHAAPWLLAVLLLVPACAIVEPATTGDEPERRPPAETPAEEEARTVQGFRIQFLTTEDKETADQRAAAAQRQWDAPVQVVWKAPSYRVRLGAFASRLEAQNMLAAVQEQYPDALLVPDTVTIRPD